MRIPSAILFALLITPTLVGAARAADGTNASGFSAGISVRPQVDTAALGLPLYPGATPARDQDGDSAAASLGLWGGAFGLRLQAMKLRTPDAVDTVARYYREALAASAPVLECPREGPPEPPSPAGSGPHTLRCDNDRPPPGGQLFKTGRPDDVRMVIIQPGPGGTQLQLVHLRLRGLQ